MAKAVTKDGKTEKTYFLYDGNNVIMESDGNEVTAKNTYAGPLLLRTVFDEDGTEETYQYLYNAHGDVVTLLTDGEVVATYYYDPFGNILEQTGEVDNSILYAGYQYDEETGLYYINARMYDPVTARFLQADTYAGSIDDPLSLNLYTYCLNNPQKYVDPSGHFAILPFIIIGLVAAGIGAGMEYISQKYIEKRDVIDYRLVIYEGVFNAIIAVASMGTANLGVAAARQAGKLTFRTIVKTVAVEVAFGTVEGAIDEVGRQLVTGTSIDNLDYDEIASSAALGGFTGGLGGAAGVGLDALKQTRVVRKLVQGAKGKIADVANVLMDSSVGKRFQQMDLQFFAGDEVYTSASKTFYTVQNSVDAKRLLNDGLPWPTEPYRANLGDGVYAWGNKEDALNYFNLKSKRTSNLQLLEFEVSQSDLNKMNKLDLTKMSDEEVNAFLDSYARLNGGVPKHGYDYIQRMTGLGVENYFNGSVFEKLKFKGGIK